MAASSFFLERLSFAPAASAGLSLAAQPQPAQKSDFLGLPCGLCRQKRQELGRNVGGRVVAAARQSAQVASVAVESKPSANGAQVQGFNNGKAVVTFGFPKGSLQQSTQDLFQRAGYTLKFSERGYFPGVDDEELQFVLFRAQEISRYVEDGVLDAGICGRDWVVENDSDVHEVCELQYSKATSMPARWVLAVEEDSPVQSPRDLAGGIVASELVKTTRKFFEEQDIKVKKVEYSWGATEVKARLPGVQAIVDITETGSSLRANKLRVIGTVLSSTTRLIANKAAWEDPKKRRKIEDIATLLQGAIEGRGKVGLKMNVERSRLDDVLAALPAEKSPTISPLMEGDFCAVEVICDAASARDLVPRMKRIGATGILTYPLDILIK